MQSNLGALRLRDLEIFDDVARALSIREVARRRRSSSGQISKVIQNLESVVGTKLFKRSVSGVVLTAQGTEFRNLTSEILSQSERMENLLSGDRKTDTKRVLAIGGTSFLNTHFITPVVCRYSVSQLNTGFRFLDLTPDQMVGVGLRGGFELAVHYGAISWPSTWLSRNLGRSKWVLCARRDHPLSKRPSLKQILDYAFVVPTYWTAEGLARGNDQFPVPLSKRKQGFETATAEAAVPIVINTDQLAFLPKVLVKPFLESKVLREVRSSELNLVEREVFLSAKSDSVPAHVFEKLSSLMSEELKR